MLHEILMCLLGNIGGLFQYKLEDNRRKIKLVENLELIHPAEVEICNKLAELGNFYKRICEFVENYSFQKSFEEKQLKYGLYLTSLCKGLESIVLAPYRSTISDLEKNLLTEHYLNVSYLQTHLESNFLLFSTICNLLDDLESKKLHGCQIVDLVYRHTISGNSLIKKTFNEILCVVHEVMYKQLRDWMISGALNDKYDEFYICMDKKASGNYVTSAVDKEKGDEDAAYKPTNFSEFEDQLSSRYSQYMLNSLRVPSYLNFKTANKILFTGELLQLFQAKYLNELFSKGEENKIQHVSEFDKSLTSEFNLMTEKLNSFSKDIYAISKEEFSIINFEGLINKIRNLVSESVWSLLVEKYNLMNEFQKLKYMFLIGRGELFSTFLDSSKTLLNKNVDQNFEYNINYLFQKAISRMLLDDESWLSKFRIILKKSRNEKTSSQDGWSRITLSYKVEWPFHSLITQNVLKKYNEIFTFLLLIRRAHSELNQCFLLQMSSRRIKNIHIDPKVCLTRYHMSFFIENFQFYIQADVLETQFTELETQIKQSKDFEQIRFAHDTFLTKIQSQLFIFDAKILACINKILESCLSFSTIVMTYAGNSKEIPQDKIKNVIDEFQHQTSTLFKIIKALAKKHIYLDQLLTRINFNNYLVENDGFIIK